jgi:hypothetical protein
MSPDMKHAARVAALTTTALIALVVVWPWPSVAVAVIVTHGLGCLALVRYA